MTDIHVQFSDETEAEIISYFGSPQDPAVWPNQGTIVAEDARWHKYYEAIPPTARILLPEPA